MSKEKKERKYSSKKYIGLPGQPMLDRKA